MQGVYLCQTQCSGTRGSLLAEEGDPVDMEKRAVLRVVGQAHRPGDDTTAGRGADGQAAYARADCPGASG